jgi:hypothetical protein
MQTKTNNRNNKNYKIYKNTNRKGILKNDRSNTNKIINNMIKTIINRTTQVLTTTIT